MKKEIYLTSDPGILGLIENCLNKESIEYQIKTTNSGVMNRTTGFIIGRIGENTAREIMYYVYVNNKDVSKAKRIIDYAIRSR